jgi:membrane-bound lytic murein transglycosylase D
LTIAVLSITFSCITQFKPSKIVYKVKSGDYLSKIAQKYEVSVADLKRWNKGVIKHNKVNKGQKLKIYSNKA